MKNSEVVYEVTPKFASNPLDYKVITKQLLLFIGVTTGFKSPKQMHKLLAFLGETVLKRSNLLSVLYYFLVERASTVPIIMEELELQEQTVYRLVNYLKKTGFIVPAYKVRRGSKKGGPKTTIYALPDYSPEDIKKATQREEKRIIPFFDFTKQVYNLVLEEFIDQPHKDEVHRNIVLATVKGENKFGFSNADVTDDVCRMLVDEGVKVWR